VLLISVSEDEPALRDLHRAGQYGSKHAPSTGQHGSSQHSQGIITTSFNGLIYEREKESEGITIHYIPHT
jgi:hypothetical protein